MKILFFDTETTGIPFLKKTDDYTKLSVFNFARLIQFSMIIYDKVTHKREEYDFIIKPFNFKINNHHIHGITDQIAQTKGISIFHFFNVLNKIFKKNDIKLLVAHNIDFDINIICSELYRYKKLELLDKFKTLDKFCTMKNSKHIVKSTNKNGHLKYPKLSELYTFLFNQDPTNLHNSLYDTRYLTECYIKLFKHKIDIDIIKHVLDMYQLTEEQIELLFEEYKLDNLFAIAEHKLNRSPTLNSLTDEEYEFYIKIYDIKELK